MKGGFYLYNQEWSQYIHQLHTYLQNQNKIIEEMRQMIQSLHGEVNELKIKESQPPVVRNEYKFDLLKIERLEGTLNIGLTPNGTQSSIDEFAVDQAMQVPQARGQDETETYHKIQNQIHTYLDHDAYHTLMKIEQHFSYPLDDPYRKFIIEDIKKQINSRIQHYVQKLQFDGLEEHSRNERQQEVVAKVKMDIEKTFETFIRNLPKKEPKPE